MGNQIIIAFCVANRGKDQLKQNLVSMLEAENEQSGDDIEARAYEHIKSGIDKGELNALLTVGLAQTSVSIKSIEDKGERKHFLLALAGDYQTQYEDWFDSTESKNELKQFIDKVVCLAGSRIKKAVSDIDPLAAAVLLEDEYSNQTVFEKYSHTNDNKYQSALEFGKQVWEKYIS